VENASNMEPVIRKLIVEGFRSIRSEVVDFDNPTFLVGRNGSGKSNLVDALAFLGECMTPPYPWISSWWGRRRAIPYGAARPLLPGAVRTLGISVVFGAIDDEISTARYSLAIVPTGDHFSPYHVEREQCVIEGQGSRRAWFERVKGEPFRTSVGGLQIQLADEALALPLVSGDSRFAPVFRALVGIRAYSIDPDRVREWQLPDRGLALHGDGDNAASVLQRINDHDPDDLRRICEILGAIVPSIERVDVKEYGNKLGLEFTQRWDDGPVSLTLDGSSMSDGTLRALGLLAAVYQRQTPSVMAIEEPEATIHPGALGVILDIIRHASERTQVIVTTHSPEVLDADWLEDRHIRIVSWQDGATHVTPLDIGSREALRQHLMTAGELLRSNALEGMPPGSDTTQQPPLFQDIVA
jgi:energy-coupling factor transporter ATP-binding protein EcfA2